MLCVLGTLFYAIFFQVGSALGYLEGVTPELEVAGLMRWPPSVPAGSDRHRRPPNPNPNRSDDGSLTGTLLSWAMPTLLYHGNVSYCRGLDWQGFNKCTWCNQSTYDPLAHCTKLEQNQIGTRGSYRVDRSGFLFVTVRPPPPP